MGLVPFIGAIELLIAIAYFSKWVFRRADRFCYSFGKYMTVVDKVAIASGVFLVLVQIGSHYYVVCASTNSVTFHEITGVTFIENEKVDKCSRMKEFLFGNRKSEE